MNPVTNVFLSFNGTREKVVMVQLDFVQNGPDPAVCSTSEEHYTAKNYRNSTM